MRPIHELLNRIRWDAGFAPGDFELGYSDRVEGRVTVLPLRQIEFTRDQQTFQFADLEGRVHRVPFHRVREVYPRRPTAFATRKAASPLRLH
jgi:uncharacterized protein (UPF0248 family)